MKYLQNNKKPKNPTTSKQQKHPHHQKTPRSDSTEVLSQALILKSSRLLMKIFFFLSYGPLEENLTAFTSSTLYQAYREANTEPMTMSRKHQLN